MTTPPHVPWPDGPNGPARPTVTYSYVTPASDGNGHLALFDADSTLVQLFFRVTVRPDGTRTNHIFATETSSARAPL